MDRLKIQLVAALQAQLDGGRGTIPEAGVLLWNIFGALARARSYGFGPNPITYAEIDAYSRLMRWPLTPEHVEIIVAMDAAWLAWAAGERKRREGKGTTPAGSGQALTPTLFDAVLGMG